MLKNKNFLLTPHIASVSMSYWKKQINLINKNLSCYKNNNHRKMLNLIYVEGEPV